jgi:hypothetical protein
MDFTEYIRSLPKAKAEKLLPEEFFRLITESENNARKFIKKLLVPAVKARASLNLRASYHEVLADCTNAAASSIAKNYTCNFTAFSTVILRKFRITKLDLKALVEAADNQTDQSAVTSETRDTSETSETKQSELITVICPKAERLTAKMYFKEMTSSRETLIAFIQEHLAPAVRGRTLHNVSGAYYGAVAKNTCETATDVVHNVACNYRAFKKKLEAYSIDSEELSKLLEVDVSYKPSKKVKTKSTSAPKEVKTLDILRDNLMEYIPEGEKLELLIQSIYTELKPVINKAK